MTTVWIIVDDTDPRIQYSEEWFLFSPNNGVTTSGETYNNTIHSSSVNGTSFSFRFNGTSRLAVYVTWLLGDGPQRVVDCIIDDIVAAQVYATPNSTPSTVGILNNQVSCQGKTGVLGNGEHELKLTAGTFIPDQDQSIYFDYIVYESLPNAPLDGEVLQLGNSVYEQTQDPHFAFGSGWLVNDNGKQTTSKPGSSVTITFNGSTATLMGELTNGSSNVGFYSLDGSTPVTFDLFTPEVPGDNGRWTNQELFSIPDMFPGTHSLVVTHNGTTSGMPLTLDYLMVTALTAAQQAALPFPSPASSSVSPLPGPSSPLGVNQASIINIGAIIGGTLGGIVLFMLAGFIIIRWRKRRLATSGSTSPSVSPFVVDHLSSSHVNNLATMKPEQRLADTRNQVHERNNRLAEATARLQQSPMFHTDSGVRFIDSNVEVPPEYVAL